MKVKFLARTLYTQIGNDNFVRTEIEFEKLLN